MTVGVRLEHLRGLRLGLQPSFMQTCGGSAIKEQEDHENKARVREEEVSFRDAPQIGEKLKEEKVHRQTRGI